MTIHLSTPLDGQAVRRLKVGDRLTFDGRLFTARDAAHRKILEAVRHNESLPFDPTGLALYHCGPVVRQVEGGWDVVSAGPTTSARMESLQPDVLRVLGIRLVIGKGGMGPATLATLREVGAVYAQFTGGAGALSARSLAEVASVHWLDELGMPEAVWIFEAAGFGPLIVTMDAHGMSLHDEQATRVSHRLAKIHARIDGISG